MVFWDMTLCSWHICANILEEPAIPFIHIALSFTQKKQAAGPMKLVTPIYKDMCSLERLLLCMYFCNCYNKNKNDKSLVIHNDGMVAHIVL